MYMNLKKFSQEVNDQLFKVDGRQMSMLEFVDMSVSTHKSRSDEHNFTTVRKGKEIVKIPRSVHFNGIELSQAQFRALVDIRIEELSPVGFRNLLGALSIYVPDLFKDKALFSQTEDFAKSELGRRALAYKAAQARNQEMSRGGEHYF